MLRRTVFMGRSRKKYSAEFRLEAVRMASRDDSTPTDVARGLGVDPSNVLRWKRAYDKLGEQAFAEPGKPDTSGCDRALSAEEIRQLRRERDEARQERDILKKALAYFANQRD